MRAHFFMSLQQSVVRTAICLSVVSVVTACGGGGDDDKDNEPANKLPVISNITPLSDAIVKDVAQVLLSANVSDEDGTISKVEFIVDGEVVGQASAAPYQFNWTPDESDHYELTVKATDDKGGSKTSSVNFTAVGFSCTASGPCDYTVKNYDHVVMAFYPYWRVGAKPINTIPFEKLTHVIYSFATPALDGELVTTDVDGSIDALVTAAHAKGVKAYVSIGGAGGGDPFPEMAKSPRNIALFADRVKCYVAAHCLDGVDIDWEHWTGEGNVIPAESNGLVNLLTELRSVLHEDIEISADVYATNWFGKHYLDGVYQQVTYVNTMLYDLSGTWSAEGPHSAYSEVIDDGSGTSSINSWGLMYWNGYRNWPIEKTVVGMPFYGKDFAANGGEGVDYSVIVTRVTDAGGDINADKFGKTYYDGPETAAKKAAYARDNGYAGVMFWELTGDTDVADKSLLNAIDSELNQD